MTDAVVHVAAGVAHDRRAGGLDERHLALVDVDAVGQQRVFVERTALDQPLDDALSEARPMLSPRLHRVLATWMCSPRRRAHGRLSAQAASVSSDIVNEACAPINPRASRRGAARKRRFSSIPARRARAVAVRDLVAEHGGPRARRACRR